LFPVREHDFSEKKSFIGFFLIQSFSGSSLKSVVDTALFYREYLTIFSLKEALLSG
jgi:hypothetical protein